MPYYEWEASIKARTLSKSGCPKCSRSKVSEAHKKSVEQIDENGKKIHAWDSVRKCAASLLANSGGTQDSIEKSVAKVCRGERNSWKGMKFRYVQIAGSK